MSSTIKQIYFSKEPMNSKPVSDIPGVGSVLQKKLNDLGFHKAKDLYELLKNLGFSESKFYLWMKKNCNGGHVHTCYKALMAWHTQFAHLESLRNEPDDDVDKQNFRRRTLSRGRRSAPPPTRRPVLVPKPIQNNTPPPAVAPPQSNPWGTDPTSSFFYSMSETVKNFPRVLQSQIKSQVFEIINDADAKQAEEDDARTQATQWRNTRAHPQDPHLDANTQSA